MSSLDITSEGLLAQQQNQHLSPIDKVASKAEAGALKLTRQALAGEHSAEYGDSSFAGVNGTRR